jgi:hypothetical protein
MEVIWWQVKIVREMVQKLPAQSAMCPDQREPHRDGCSHATQWHPHEHVLNGTSVSLCHCCLWDTHISICGPVFHEFHLVCNSRHHRTERQLAGPVWKVSTPGRLEFHSVTLFPFALIHHFCCTAGGQLLVCHANDMITCNRPYLLPTPQTGFTWTTLTHEGGLVSITVLPLFLSMKTVWSSQFSKFSVLKESFYLMPILCPVNFTAC